MGVDDEITLGIADFIKSVQGGKDAKQAALDAATTLVEGALNAVLGASTGNAQQQEGLVTLYLNFTFVRIRYWFYSFDTKGEAWGMQDVDKLFASVSAVTVIPLQTLSAEDMTFLLAQAMEVPPDDPKSFEALEKVKVQMLVLQWLGVKTQNTEALTLDDIANIAKEMEKTNAAIADAFSDLKDAPSLQELQRAAGLPTSTEPMSTTRVYKPDRVRDRKAPRVSLEASRGIADVQASGRSFEAPIARGGCGPFLLGRHSKRNSK